MQSCPECGSESREGVRFCTNCGHRFPDGSDAGAWHVAATGLEPQQWGTNRTTADFDAANESWPAAPVAAESTSVWDPGTAGMVPNEPEEPSSSIDQFAVSWQDSSPSPWPDAPAQANSVNGADETWSEPNPAAPKEREVEPADPGLGKSEAQTDALELLDQLRVAIVSIGTAGAVDLTGVISDLEVAATPPGAVASDELAELREAVFAARENPRDIDTIVDLTRRIDGLAALVIAYDRAIAAIERSLDVLRDQQTVAEDQSSPRDVGEEPS